MKTFIGIGILVSLSACAWIEAHDPPLPVNSDTYQQCPNVPPPGCLADGQECPLEGTHCIDLPVQTCALPPCADLNGAKRALDAGK